MTSSFHLSILTPLGEIFRDSVESLMAPGEEGHVGILANHAPMLTALQPGVLEVKQEGQSGFFIVGEGVLEVANNEAMVLVDHAERIENAETGKDKVKELRGLQSPSPAEPSDDSS